MIDYLELSTKIVMPSVNGDSFISSFLIFMPFCFSWLNALLELCRVFIDALMFFRDVVLWL